MALTKKQQKQEETLRLLESLVRRLGLKVSYGDMRFAGLRLKSGQCLFRGEPWLVLDRKQTFDEKVDLFREAIVQQDPEIIRNQDIPADLAKILGLEFPPAVEHATDK